MLVVLMCSCSELKIWFFAFCCWFGFVEGQYLGVDFISCVPQQDKDRNNVKKFQRKSIFSVQHTEKTIFQIINFSSIVQSMSYVSVICENSHICET